MVVSQLGTNVIEVLALAERSKSHRAYLPGGRM